ncbi:aminotransferase class I/II-fold pyridoxal phosphate-dependent enzyme [Streptomyces sp. N50]|uniref:aminotransferase class I/II-fold pyridoxal phosphate-dependent enzyme n=1 Tax=Streptomyces sp. N50 TaxID=3081765 RepID=UPI00296257AB|nr:aminotransferase class I/II-fold pyridoxal phosphate-dependent enzyme [Streptomyces sp. N50]WOX11060.1 aminotransferase class I/II-fold pyridoxal phosphate-dependent enzyme [Streptomyces sp. N50]
MTPVSRQAVTSHVSRQAARLVAGSPAIAEAHFRAEALPYHPRLRPDGWLNLGTAENRLVQDLHTEPPRPLTARDTRYAPLYGTPELRAHLARHLTVPGERPVDPEDLVVVAGATAALDVVATALCDPGEAIVVPTPCYGAFDTDLGGRSGARLLLAPPDPEDGHGLSVRAVDRTLAEARRDGVDVRAVALASPANPTGEVHLPARLRELAAVAAHHGVDIVADEIYAGSVFGPRPFTSLRTVAADPARTHTVWGFAKDFGLPGFKAGVLHTTDPEIRAAARALAYFAPVSTHTQAQLTTLLADPARVDAFLAENRRRLGASYAHATALLDTFGIPYAPAQAGCSIWADLGDRLPHPGFAGERALWREILDRTHVSILPGEAFHAPRPGWFRVCHSLDAALVTEALTRLGHLLTEKVEKGAPHDDPRHRHTPRPAGPLV